MSHHRAPAAVAREYAAAYAAHPSAPDLATALQLYEIPPEPTERT